MSDDCTRQEQIQELIDKLYPNWYSGIDDNFDLASTLIVVLAAVTVRAAEAKMATEDSIKKDVVTCYLMQFQHIKEGINNGALETKQ